MEWSQIIALMLGSGTVSPSFGCFFQTSSPSGFPEKQKEVYNEFLFQLQETAGHKTAKTPSIWLLRATGFCFMPAVKPPRHQRLCQRACQIAGAAHDPRAA